LFPNRVFHSCLMHFLLFPLLSFPFPPVTL
jgi:hypothetical protein